MIMQACGGTRTLHPNEYMLLDHRRARGCTLACTLRACVYAWILVFGRIKEVPYFRDH